MATRSAVAVGALSLASPSSSALAEVSVLQRPKPEAKRWDKYNDPNTGKDWWWCESTQEARLEDPTK